MQMRIVTSIRDFFSSSRISNVVNIIIYSSRAIRLFNKFNDQDSCPIYRKNNTARRNFVSSFIVDNFGLYSFQREGRVEY